MTKKYHVSAADAGVASNHVFYIVISLALIAVILGVGIVCLCYHRVRQQHVDIQRLRYYIRWHAGLYKALLLVSIKGEKGLNHPAVSIPKFHA